MVYVISLRWHFAFSIATVLVLIASAPGLMAAEPIRVALTLDTSPGTEQVIGLLRPRAFEQGDLASVITVSSGPPRVLLQLSEDRDALARALQRAGIRVGARIGRIGINDNATADLAGAIKLACDQLRQSGATDRSGQAIVLLFGSTDPNLSFQMETVKTALDAANARLYAVQIDRAVEQRRSPLGISPSTLPIPVLTAQLIAELAEYSGGRIYRRNWDLKEILQHVRKL